jgi:hypothetical protein
MGDEPRWHDVDKTEALFAAMHEPACARVFRTQGDVRFESANRGIAETLPEASDQTDYEYTAPVGPPAEV